MKYFRDYTCITDEDVEARIKSLRLSDKLSRRNTTEEFVRYYVESERDLNLTIPEDTRKIWRAQQVLLEKAHYVKKTHCFASKMWLEEQYLKENKWLSNRTIVNKLRNEPCDENFHFHGDK